MSRVLRLVRLPVVPAVVIAAGMLAWAAFATGAEAPASAPGTAPPPVGDNPLRDADEATREEARAEAWIVFQRSCRPCHGNLGAGDGPYGATFAEPAADLRRASRDIAADPVRFTRIRDGAAARSVRPWESAMPAFGGELTDRQIWGLVLLLEDLGKTPSGLDPNATAHDVYAARCAACHGANGKGDGPLAAELLPMPRNFVQANYRFRSTEAGAAPLDSDAIGSTVRGLGVTAMGKLTVGSQQLEEMPRVLFGFAPERFTATPPIFPRSPLPSGSLGDLATRGREVYEKANCAECHGVAGRGDGPVAATLKDDTGRPSIPTDLTKHWHYKGGASAADIFRTLSTGMNGTPMESYATSLTSDERWFLAYYLERKMGSRVRFMPTVHALETTDPMPSDPNAELWNRIPPTVALLGPQVEVPPYWTQPTVDAVEVVVVTNGDQLGIRLAWNDATKSVASEDNRAAAVDAALARHGSWRLPDRIALQLPETLDPSGTRPPLYLGDTEHPVLRWTWSADRHERGEHTAIVERVTGPTATPTPVSDAAPVQTFATHADGQWRVLLVTKRPPKEQAAMAIAVHAWDGAHGEAGSWHSLSSWLTVKLR